LIEKLKSSQVLSIISNIFQKYSLAVLFLFFFLFSVFYVSSRSFYIDESMVALSIVRSGISPFEPLKSYNQVSPWGFVLITKLVLLLFGAGDLQFRLPGILIYFVSMSYLAIYLRRRYSLMVALVFSFVILANPVLLRYSTEFKHYIYEFSFVSILLTSYFEILKNDLFAKYIYAISAGLSIFFGNSIIIVIAAIFGVEMLRRLRLSFKKPFRSKWFYFHGLVFTGFLAWYIVSITPNLSFNLLNYPQIFNIDVDLGNITNFNYWKKLLELINSVIKLPISQILVVSLLACVYLFLSKKITRLDITIISIPFTVYLIIYTLNLAGIYPIVEYRYILFMIPAVFHLFAYLVFKINTARIPGIIQYLMLMLLVFSSANILINHQMGGNFFFQEIKPILRTLSPTDKVFLFFSAQPGYNWYKLSLYKDLPIPLNPDVNADSGPAITQEKMVTDLPKFINEPGAWPTIALLTKTKNRGAYISYLLDQITQAGNSKIVFSHRDGEDFRKILKNICVFSYIEKNKGAYILDVTCP